jgi:hypothetical protein
MGKLTPGATYVYERSGDEIYARESGATDRTLIGYEYEAAPASQLSVARPHDGRTHDGRPLIEHILEDKMWHAIRREARTNASLQKALDRVILLYRLSKDNPQ